MKNKLLSMLVLGVLFIPTQVNGEVFHGVYGDIIFSDVNIVSEYPVRHNTTFKKYSKGTGFNELMRQEQLYRQFIEEAEYKLSIGEINYIRVGEHKYKNREGEIEIHNEWR